MVVFKFSSHPPLNLPWRKKVFLLILLLFAWGCSKNIYMGSPYERFDHNRTRPLTAVPGSNQPNLDNIRTFDDSYTPYGSEDYPTLFYNTPNPGKRALPDANLVPVYTGLSLPIKSCKPDNNDKALFCPEGTRQRSDRDDLIDYLASGRFEYVGVEPKDAPGGPDQAEIQYRPVLELLGKKIKTENWKNHIANNLEGDVEFPDQIFDARYFRESWKNPIIGFRFQHFWFILYAYKKSEHFNRLVVIPVRDIKQNQKEKTADNS